MKQTSCLNNLVDFLNGVFAMYDETMAVDAVDLDFFFPKVFDKFCHWWPLGKLKSLNIDGNLKWLGDWLY